MKFREEINSAKIRNVAMNFLTGREFSRAELSSKLCKRFDGHQDINNVLDQLQQDGLQSDHRFAGAFLRSRVSRGQGMSRIRADILSKGIEKELLNLVLAEQDIDWYALARDVAKRKFGSQQPLDQKAKAKQMRFLQYRGFNFDQIKCALCEVIGD